MAIYKLGEICSYVEGYVNPKITEASYFGGKAMNWMRVKDLKNGEVITETELNLSQKGLDLRKNNDQIFKKGSIVWSKSGSVGNCAILGIDTCANRGVLNIIPNDLVVKDYLYYFLLRNKEFFKSQATGAVLKHLYGPQLMQQEIDLPSIDEQKEIIDIIKPIERSIELLINVSSIIRNIQLSKEFSNDFISNVVTWYSKGYSYKPAEKKGGKFRVYTTKNIKSDKHDNTDVFTDNLLEVGDILTGLSGTIGTSGMIKESGYVSNQRTLSLRSSRPLQIMCTIEKSGNYISSVTTGAVQKNIKASDILGLKVLKPIGDDLYEMWFHSEMMIAKFKIILHKMISILI